MNTIELEEVQGYVIRGYSNMRFSRFALLKVNDAVLAKKWINEISGSLTNANIVSKDNLPDTCLNIAFARKGLEKLGMDTDNINTFSPPFKEGMTTPHRGRLLGDVDSSDPEHWEWGGEKDEPETEILLLVFGKTEEICLDYYSTLKEGFSKNGLMEDRNLDGRTLKDNKEHFGFRDGISQPIIKGSGRTGPEYNCVNPGEFILGYKNNYNVYPDSPRIKTEQGNINLLHAAPDTGQKDLGRNGTYLIVRQMQQDVEGFWEFMNEKTQNPDGSVNEKDSVKLAAQMVGRWPSGAPLTKYPDKDPGGVSDDNDFLYAKDDGDGAKCPFGSHLRRMNPRDSFENDSEKESKELSNRHRLIRRARLYGDPIIGSPLLEEVSKNPVGLYFNCFAADISRQFEFLQYTWSNYPKIKQLYNDPDPIIGVLENPIEGKDQIFTIQGKPVNQSIKGLKRFIEIKGGAYFFFPSITTVRYLTTI